MATTRHYFRNTATEALNTGSGGNNYFDTNVVQGTPTTQGSQNINDTAYLFAIGFRQEIGAVTVNSTNWTVSVDINSFIGTADIRFRIRSYDSSGTAKTSSAYSSSYGSAGIASETLTFNPTMVAGDYIGVEIEVRRTGGHGNVSVVLNVNDADAYFEGDYDVPSATRPRHYITH